MDTDRKQLVRAALKRRRPRRSQKWLAERIGVTPPYLSQILNRKRRGSVTVLLRLAEEIGVDVAKVA